MTDHPTVTSTHLVKSWEDVTRTLKNIINVVNRMNRGKINFTGTFTLTANAATSILTDNRLLIDSCVVFDPVTANAATELYGATFYALEANRNNGAWTFTHANNAGTDREFRYAILG